MEKNQICECCGSTLTLKSIVLGHATEMKDGTYICRECTVKKDQPLDDTKEQNEVEPLKPKNQFFQILQKVVFSELIKSKQVKIAWAVNLLGFQVCWLIGFGHIFFLAAAILSIIAMCKDYLIEGTVSFILTFFTFVATTMIFADATMELILNMQDYMTNQAIEFLFKNK